MTRLRHSETIALMSALVSLGLQAAYFLLDLSDVLCQSDWYGQHNSLNTMCLPSFRSNNSHANIYIYKYIKRQICKLKFAVYCCIQDNLHGTSQIVQSIFSCEYNNNMHAHIIRHILLLDCSYNTATLWHSSQDTSTS